MASDERADYRADRKIDDRSRDYLAERERKIRHLRRMRDNWEKPLALLGRGSPYRAPAEWRASIGAPLLTRSDRLA